MMIPQTTSPARTPLTATKRARLIDILLATLLIAGVYTLFKYLLLTHFYINGGYILDSGWMASLMWKNGLIPLNPIVALPVYYQNFLQNHSFLLTPFLSELSYLFPFPMAVWFAVVYGAAHALTALIAYVIFRYLLGTGTWSQIGAFFSAATFILSAPVIENFAYPHLEYLLFPTASILVLGLILKRSWMVWVGLILAAAVREDCGFHMAAPFLLVLLCTLLFPRFFGRLSSQTWNRYLSVAIAAILLSLGSMFIPSLFVHKESLFQDEYLGHPIYGHVTPTFAINQLLFFLTEKPFVWVPLLLLFIMGLIRRNVIFVSASLAYVPWITLNLMGVIGSARQFESYHTFPLYMMFLFACLPPPNRIEENDKKEKPHSFQPDPVRAAIVFGVTLVSLILLPWNDWWRVGNDFLNAPTSEQITHTERFFIVLPQLRKELGPLIADAPTVALAPRLFSSWEGRPEFNISKLEKTTDSLIFFGHSWNQDALWLALTPAFHIHQVTGTPFFIATRRRIEDMPLLNSLSLPVSSIYSLMSFRGNVTVDPQGATLEAIDGIVGVFGPYVRLPAGHYQLALTLQRKPGADTNGCTIDVAANETIFASSSCFTGSSAELGANPLLQFDVTPADKDKHFEFRLFQKGQRPIRLSSLTITRNPDPASAQN